MSLPYTMSDSEYLAKCELKKNVYKSVGYRYVLVVTKYSGESSKSFGEYKRQYVKSLEYEVKRLEDAVNIDENKNKSFLKKKLDAYKQDIQTYRMWHWSLPVIIKKKNASSNRRRFIVVIQSTIYNLYAAFDLFDVDPALDNIWIKLQHKTL